MAAAGRPIKYPYHEEYAEQVHKLALVGLIDDQIAKWFGVSTEILRKSWAAKHPEFAKRWREGKEIADGNVVHSLYKRAVGFSHPAVKIFNDEGVAMIVPYIEQYPPDTTACIFWLKNRQSLLWRDRTIIDHNVIDFSDELAAARERAKKLREQRIAAKSEATKAIHKAKVKA